MSSRLVRKKAGCGYRATGPGVTTAITGFRASGYRRRMKGRCGPRHGGDGMVATIVSTRDTGAMKSATTVVLITAMDTWEWVL